ncbi:hypothetical protein [Ferrimonas marina]|uniref:Uncharacterized protein n=1 Tax=Ferrimonas marina TaxID=299255 RepID=A0A1M5U7H0_9GAMM|nr:hypothetical protein [Ferrimonas marina]SHH58992.1 hypothetical protein SAMN02745129_2442 [Ferrimonas marina]
MVHKIIQAPMHTALRVAGEVHKGRRRLNKLPSEIGANESRWKDSEARYGSEFFTTQMLQESDARLRAELEQLNEAEDGWEQQLKNAADRYQQGVQRYVEAGGRDYCDVMMTVEVQDHGEFELFQRALDKVRNVVQIELLHGGRIAGKGLFVMLMPHTSLQTCQEELDIHGITPCRMCSGPEIQAHCQFFLPQTSGGWDLAGVRRVAEHIRWRPGRAMKDLQAIVAPTIKEAMLLDSTLARGPAEAISQAFMVAPEHCDSLYGEKSKNAIPLRYFEADANGSAERITPYSDMERFEKRQQSTLEMPGR